MRSFTFLAGLAASAAAAEYPSIKTTSGYVRGGPSDYRDNITVYKGIPYASPPTGSLRWKAPTAPTPWTDVLNATSFGPQCAQSYSPAGIFSTGNNATSEDCLSLNVWTPTFNDTADIASQNLPVFVWIFGGRFEGGSGDVKTYDGSGLASKDIIVVTLNYRLGAFGFLAHPDLSAESGQNASGNYGLLDQQFALQWVQSNIANFGGNPDQVTVGGQSAGSASALDMMYSPLSRGLIHGVISESGARDPNDPEIGGLATSYRTKDTAEAQGVAFLQSLNVSSINELRNVSVETLIENGNESDDVYGGTAFENVTSAFQNPPLWRPVIDGYVLTHTYGEALRLNDHADVPILTGNNKDESGASPSTNLTVEQYNTTFAEMFRNFTDEFFALYPASTDAQASNISNTLFRDISRVGAWLWASDWAMGGATSDVYTYYWTTAPAENRANGAYHGAELWYTFNNIPYASYDNATWTEADYAVEAIASEYWANFIRSGNPNGGNLTYFPPTTADVEQTMWLGDSWGAGNLSDSEQRISFLEEWLSLLHEY